MFEAGNAGDVDAFVVGKGGRVAGGAGEDLDVMPEGGPIERIRRMSAPW